MNFTAITITITENIDVYNYTCSQGYLLLPAINEYTWHHNVRVALYLLGIIWCFLGVAHIADIFMAAIERITSKTRTVRIADPEVPGGVREVQLKVWNDTVANLSLLALGTSAPEILLSVIEIVGNDFTSGELGPGTIVGSAAFNLLFISAICISCVPDGEVRRIHSFKVFGVTSFSCVFAYVWMVFVLVVTSPNVIEIWEAVLTFAFFPILLVVAYSAEKDFFLKQEKKSATSMVGIPLVVANGDVVTTDEILAHGVVANGDVVIADEIHAHDDSEVNQADSVVTNGDVITTDETHANDVSTNGDVVTTVESHADDEKHSITEMKSSSDHKNKTAVGKRRTSSDDKAGQSVDPIKSKTQGDSKPRTVVITTEEEEMRKLAKQLTLQSGYTPDMVADIITRRFVEETPHSRGWYRSNAIRGLTGAKQLISQTAFDTEELNQITQNEQVPEEDHPAIKAAKVEADPSHGGNLAVVEFTSASVAVLENEGKVRLGIRRTGRMNIPVSIRVQTCDGTALAVEDYKPYDEVLEFKVNEALKSVHIEIVDDNEWEPDEFFFVKLKVVQNSENCVLGNLKICEVTIINDDEPGVMEFSKPSFVVKETEPNVMIPVLRKNGADGQVTVKWVTKDISAVEGVDYLGKEGEILFESRETSKDIIIPLIASQKMDRDDSFQIEITDVGSAIIGRLHKTIVTIVNDEEFNALVSRIVNLSICNQEALELHDTTYRQQFVEAMNVNGGDLESATFMSYVLHFLSFFWKIMFAFIPPTHYLGGWATFIASLSLIGLLTAIIGDLASIFGCLIGLEDSITAITLVAMGTSMPDTFASKTAAIMEKTADNSIGNVNGSNSVNVFLGLGLPWLMASVYHYMKGDQFVVKAGSLGFTVIIYSLVAVIAIAVLIMRRMSPSIGAELGGPKLTKILCSIFFISMWVFYVVISALQTKGIIKVHIG